MNENSERPIELPKRIFLEKNVFIPVMWNEDIDKEHYGEYWVNEPSIHINSSKASSRKLVIQTLIHELIHAIDHHVNGKCVLSEELVSEFELAVYKVLVLNKWINTK